MEQSQLAALSLVPYLAPGRLSGRFFYVEYQMPVTDDVLRQLFRTVGTIACVGASPNPSRPSHFVSDFLVARGYRVIGINPGQAGRPLFGETAVARLSDLSAPVEMIDIFRRSSEVLPVVEEAIAALPTLRFVWIQIGVQNAEAAALARAHGLTVIENRCPKVELPRLFGQLSRAEIRAARA